jgi:hypothetical protein
LVVPLILLLAACSSTVPVKMRHPKTGQVVQCGPYDTSGMRHIAAAQHEAQCIQDYKEQGYVRVPG